MQINSFFFILLWSLQNLLYCLHLTVFSSIWRFQTQRESILKHNVNNFCFSACPLENIILFLYHCIFLHIFFYFTLLYSLCKVSSFRSLNFTLDLNYIFVLLEIVLIRIIFVIYKIEITFLILYFVQYRCLCLYTSHIHY